MSIGSFFFLHKYYRTKSLRKSLRLGFSTAIVSCAFTWGYFDLQPFITNWFYSKYIENLSLEDHNNALYYNYLERENINKGRYENQFGLKTVHKLDNKNSLKEAVLDLENLVLKNNKLNPINVEALINNKKIGSIRDECRINNKEIINRLSSNHKAFTAFESNYLKQSTLNFIKHEKRKDNLILLKQALTECVEVVEFGKIRDREDPDLL